MITVVTLPSVNIPKTVNHPSIVSLPMAAMADRFFIPALFALDWNPGADGAGESLRLRQLEGQRET